MTKLTNDNNFRIFLKNQYNNPNLVYINKENLNESIYDNKDLYYQTNTFKMADLIKADINKIVKSEKINDINNIVFAYATIYINSKIGLLYNNIVLTKNQSDKFELYGIIQIKDTSLSDEEKEYFKFYSKTGIVKYDSGIITVELNVGDKDEALNI